MRKLKVCYTIRDNLGDSINAIIFRDVLGVDLIHSSEYSSDITGIGSGLRRFFINIDSNKAKLNLIKGRLHPKKLCLFSAGFLTTPTGKEKLLRKNIEVISVRGELSKSWIAKITHRTLDCGTGDAGLLASYLLKNECVEKKYDVGIIPHDKERGEKFYEIMQSEIPNSTIIDVRGDVMTRLREIASCKTIISSSLHGLIIADSFLIPNVHVKLTNKLSGDGFKFKDYYSCFGLDDVCVDLNNNRKITMDFIIKNYQLNKQIIDNKKQEIIDDFQKIRKIKRI